MEVSTWLNLAPPAINQIDEVVVRATTVLRLTEVLGPHIELLR